MNALIRDSITAYASPSFRSTKKEMLYTIAIHKPVGQSIDHSINRCTRSIIIVTGRDGTDSGKKMDCPAALYWIKVRQCRGETGPEIAKWVAERRRWISCCYTLWSAGIVLIEFIVLHRVYRRAGTTHAIQRSTLSTLAISREVQK